MDDKIRKAAQKEFDQKIQAAEQERIRKGEPNFSERTKGTP